MIEAPLTAVESEELQRLMNGEILFDADRYMKLFNQALLYGDSTINPEHFQGLSPRLQDNKP